MHKKLVIIALALLSVVVSHPTRYSGVNCNNQDREIKSWHVHIPYWKMLPDSVNGAKDLFSRIVKKFNMSRCQSYEGHSDKSCYFVDVIHPTYFEENLGLFVSNQDIGAVAIYVHQHSGKFDVMIHPNTGCAEADHRETVFHGVQWQHNKAALR
jgi:aromatic ring-cleaving dioxygenase